MNNFINFLSSLVFIFILINSTFSYTKYDVLKYGADPNGIEDSTQAFIDSWMLACNSNDFSDIVVHQGRYLVSPVNFKGPCKSPQIRIKIWGVLLAPRDYNVLAQAKTWLDFVGVDNVSIIGGVIDAKGPSLWECKSSEMDCPDGATTLGFSKSNNIRIKGLTSLDSQMFHVVIMGCHNVQIQGMRIKADGKSPNTDGIHVQLSTRVSISHSYIATGDDCISIGPGTQDLKIFHIRCGPGHGISIGSLGKNLEEPGVQNVWVKNTIFTGTQNGVRIKSWARPSNGFVENVYFINSRMVNAYNPIVIDQNYCPQKKNCPDQGSGVAINNIFYVNIRGTSASPIAVKFDCSPMRPCTNIRTVNVHLTCPEEVAESSCTNAIGEAFGIVQPTSCLQKLL